jgi:ribose-phosphate pyrophosphokinase
VPFRPERLLTFDDGADAALRLADRLGIPCDRIEVHTFPDDERRVRVPPGGRHAAIYRPLDRPNAKLVELLLAASALRDGGVTELCLIAPYLPYMRQDIAFRPGEAVSQAVVGGLLAGAFDRFVAVDPHLHRTPDLSSVFRGKPALTLAAAPALAHTIDDMAVVIGPDEESEVLVRAIAAPGHRTWMVARKERRGDRDVRMTLPDEPSLAGRRVAIVDDMITSGTTIMTLAELARQRGAMSIDVYVTHALYDEEVARAFVGAGIGRAVSCDGIPHPSNGISLAETIAMGLKQWQ